MVNLTPKFIGFFPKQNDYENPFRNNGIIEICSVSECLRGGLDNWIDLWKHNDLGCYDSESLVQTLIREKLDSYTIFAYKLFLFCYENGELKTESDMILRANRLNITANLTEYDFVGFDIINSSVGNFFECSALSCNCASETYKVNKYCLLENLDSAICALKEVSQGNYEPGEQYLIEVYRKSKKSYC